MTTSTATATVYGFIVAEGRDGSPIWGIGATAEAALADAASQTGYSGTPLTIGHCIPASAELIRTVKWDGGALEWAIWDGVARTLAESVRR
jgi:hypothetical protein